MRLRLVSILTFIPFLLFGQEYMKVNKPIDTFFIVPAIDSFTIIKNIPDGKYKSYYNNDTSSLQYVFNVKANKITGNFISYSPRGYMNLIGTYKEDSLWTFRYGIDSDTTFREGTWSYFTCLGPTPEYMTRYDEKYEMTYNSDSLFFENWFFENGMKLKESIYHQKKGLISEINYNYDGTTFSEFEKFKDYSLKTNYNNKHDISSIIIDHDFSFSLELDTSEISYNWYNGCIVVSIHDNEENLISATWIDSNGTVRGFYDKRVNLFYNENGQLQKIRYFNKRGKIKYKKVK